MTYTCWFVVAKNPVVGTVVTKVKVCQTNPVVKLSGALPPQFGFEGGIGVTLPGPAYIKR